MGRKSSIERLPKKVRERIRALLRDNELTLDEVRATIREEFGVEYTPTRTPLWRDKKKIERWAQDMRELETVADVWVRELKDKPSGKTGRMVLELLRSLAANAVMAAREKQQLEPREITHLARAFNLIEAGGKRNIETEQKIRESVREQLAHEQAAKVSQLEKGGGLTREQAEVFRKQVLGVRA